MKKLLSLLLSLALLMSVCGLASAEGAPATSGFEIVETRRFELLGADITLYEHVKTGALVMYIANDDLNRVFDITFRTPTLDNTGIPHVFEHSTLDGSEKYPSKTLFMNLSYQTYNTYMNASTYNFMTTYPLASLSEEQLLAYADYYADSCFNPAIYTDESIFREEAWRYAMDSAEDELRIEGTVYTEMQGSYTIGSAAQLNFYGTIFPSSTYGNVHGGIPSEIPDMTWEDLRAYHAEYYHPSNSLTVLYGRFENVNAFLELLDGYFSAYEPGEFSSFDSEYTPITESVTARYEYPYAAGADTENASVAYYGFVCEGATEQELYQLDMLTTLLGAGFSVFSQRMKDELPSADTFCYVDFCGPEVQVFFGADGINEADIDTFKTIVDESIAQTAEEGFKAEDTDAVIASYKMDSLMAAEGSSVGVNLAANIAVYWSSNDNLWGYFNNIEALDSFETVSRDGTLTGLMEKYLINNPRTALSITVPVAGLKDEQDAALKNGLAEIKAEMSAEEIAEIVADTNAEDEADDSAAYIRELTAVTVESLPEDIRIYAITDETAENGARHVTADANIDGMGYASLLLDAQGLTKEQLHYFKLYTDLLAKLPSSSHTRQELAALVSRYLYDGVIKVSCMSEGEGCHVYLRSSFIALDEDMGAAYDLLGELLYETDFTDAEALKGAVTSARNTLRSTINSNPVSVILYRAYAASDDVSALFSYVTFIDYYNFLCEVEALLDSEPETVIHSLQAIQSYFNNSTNAVSAFAGNEESAVIHYAAADAFLDKLDKREILPQSYTFDSMANPEAIVIDGAVQYNMVFAPYAALGIEGYSADLDVISNLVTDTFLYPMLRDRYGVYGVGHFADEYGVSIYSYRDSNITETFEVYSQLGELVSGLTDIDQETLDGYIMSAYSGYALSGGELSDGASALLTYLDGKDQSETVEKMRALKSVTAQSVASYGPLYTALYENGILGTIGSAAAINENAALYENILNPFGVKDNSSAVYDDLAEDDWYYDAVRYCAANGYAYPVSDTRFGAEEPASLGDLAVVMYMAIGGTYDREGAVAFLSQYGIVPDAPADTPLTREDLAVYLYCFCEAVQVPVDQIAMEGYTDTAEISAGCEGMIGCMLSYGLVNSVSEGVYDPCESASVADVCYAAYVLLAE